MKKEKGTTSILESIRNKMRKIEENASANVASTSTSNDDHDDFEYLDSSSKEIVDSKHSAQTTSNISSNNQDLNIPAAPIDDDFDFLSSEENEENSTANQIPNINKDSNLNIKNDFDLNDIDLDLDTLDEQKNAPINPSTLSTADQSDFDLDLEDISETPKSNNTESEPEEIASDDDLFKDEEKYEEPINQNLNNNTEEKLEETTEENNQEDFENTVTEEKVDEPSEVLSETISDQDYPQDEEPQILPNSNVIKETEIVSPIPQNIAPKIENNSNNRTSIISENVARQASESIKELIGSIPKKQQFLQNSAPAFRSGDTIEDLVAEMLAPKLEQWLNENLPSMVEKIVRDEIQKIIPRD